MQYATPYAICYAMRPDVSSLATRSFLVTTCTQHSCASSCSFRVRASLDTGKGHAIMGLTQTIDTARALFRHNIKPFLNSSTRRLNKVRLRLSSCRRNHLVVSVSARAPRFFCKVGISCGAEQGAEGALLCRLPQSISGASAEKGSLSILAAPLLSPRQHSAATPAAPVGTETDEEETGHGCARLLLAQALRIPAPGLSPNPLLLLEGLCDWRW